MCTASRKHLRAIFNPKTFLDLQFIVTLLIWIEHDYNQGFQDKVHGKVFNGSDNCGGGEERGRICTVMEG